jgi:dolichol kinase
VAFLAVSFVAVACTPNLPLAIGLTAAPLAAAVEMFSTRIDDNLSVPLIVGLYAHLALRVFQ